MKGPVVFDFDKTLTEKDTLFGFYAFVNEDNLIFKLKRVLLLISALLYKVRMINNTQLKKIGLSLFLAGKSIELIEAKSYEYARKIELNEIYHQYFLNTPKENRLILSASYESYLKKLFPSENVIGSKLAFKNGKVFGIEINMYGIEKKRCLLKSNITLIEKLYTDSYSDQPLMDISKKTILIKDGTVVDKIIKSEN